MEEKEDVINIKVTVERYDEVIDLDDSFDLLAIKLNRAYEYLCDFVVDEKGNYIGRDKARELFRKKRVKRKEVGKYWIDFVTKVNDAFVNPTNGADSEEPLSQAQEPLQDG